MSFDTSGITEPLPNIPGGVIAGLILGLVICLALPVGGFIWARKKYGRIAKPFFIGAACFFVSQMLIRIPIVTSVLPSYPWFMAFITNHYALYGLFMAFTAGLFEEGARYLCVRFILKKERRFGDAVAFGFGHGGIEAILITGLSLGSYLAYCLMINGGTFGSLLSTLPEAQAQTLLSTMYALNFSNVLVGGAERVIAVTLHIALTVIVFRGFAVGKPGLHLIYAIAAHTAVDFCAVIFPLFGLSGWLMELAFAVLCAGTLVWALWLKKNTAQWNTVEVIENEKENDTADEPAD